MTIVNSIQEFLALTVDSPPTTIFRGETDASYALVCSLGRVFRKLHEKGIPPDDHIRWEASGMQRFADEIVQFGFPEPKNDWELAALAQHHGFPTRLIDWSLSPLVGLFFAVCKGAKAKSDARIYAFDCQWGLFRPNSEESKEITPLSYRAELIYIPRHLSPRITSQKGVFTFHPDPQEEFAPPGMQEFTIPKKNVPHIYFQLARCGIDQKHIFVDLDHACQVIADRGHYLPD